MRRGLVIGKFYPPHRGHKHLVDAALSMADEVWVIVCGKPEHVPSGELRAAWMQEIHPGAKVMLIDDRLDEDDSRLWAEHCVGWLGFAPDVVFTSEDYGEPFSRFLGCEHVLVDKARVAVPISGTAVRADPLGSWDYLEPPVRAWYAKRVCLVGAESTGKTTLAQALAGRYETVWVPEFGRDYSERMLAERGEYLWDTPDFVRIAERQIEREERAARKANRVLICDTDAFATAIWHRRYMGGRSPEVEALAAAARRPDLYLLTDANTPFEQDGLRDGEHIRDWMHGTFVAELTAQGRPFRLVTGTPEERLRRASDWIDQLLSDRGPAK